MASQAISNQPKKPVAVPEESNIRVKLFIDKYSNKVVYAEAGKDFVDYLLHTFTKPLGLAIKQDFPGAVTGGLANLHTSVVDNLSFNYLYSGATTKSAFLNPNLLKNFYTCPNRLASGCPNLVSEDSGVKCSNCGSPLTDRAVYKAPASGITQIGNGYVKGEVTYLITDDLLVKPLSTSLSIALLNQLRIRDFSNISEIVVAVDSAKGKELVKASLTSKTVLTDTFLPAKKSGYY